MATLEDIRSYLTANPGMSDAQIASAMQQYGVSPLQMAQATNIPVADIQSRYDAAVNQRQTIADQIANIQQRGGSDYDIAREAQRAGLSAADLARATGLSEADIRSRSANILDGGTPPRPTFSSIFAEWNKEHQDRFGTPVNMALIGKEDVTKQLGDLDSRLKSAQKEWDATYGQTAEGQILKANPPPDWRDVYSSWMSDYQKQFGSQYLDRPWSRDENAIRQKQELDQKYIQSVADYNKKFGTNIQPDASVLGSLAQPNEFFKQPEKDKWYQNPLNIAALIAATYFGAPYLAEALGAAEAGALGAAEAGMAGAEVLPGVGAEVFPLGAPGAVEMSAIPASTAGAGTLGSFGPLGAASDISSLSPYITESAGVGPVGNLGFGAAVPTAAETAAALTAAGFAPGTAANLAGLTLAGVGAAAPVGLSLNTVKNIADVAKKVLTPSGSQGTLGQDTTDQNKMASNLLSQGLSMLEPGSRQYSLPGNLEATYLAAPSGTSNQQQILAQLKQLYPELRGTDDKLLSTVHARVGGHIPEFITGATGHYVQGRGDGQSDEIPAMLADGEYVFDADTVAALGNGSNKAGAKVLDQMRENIREHKRSAPVGKIPPKAKSPLEYMKG